MSGRKISVLKELVEALPKETGRNSAAVPFLRKLQESVKEMTGETLPDAAQDMAEDDWIPMPFLHNMTPDIRARWNLEDLDPASSNDVPNQNLKVMALILAANIESTVGDHAWSFIEYSLKRLGFTNIVHHYFEAAEKVNHPAMAFGRSIEKVYGKTVVAAVYRGSSSVVDFISDARAEPGGFHKAGINATNELRAYCKSQKLEKEDTILFITGHSYGAACASLVGISSRDLAEPECIFCYPFATPNYIRNGLTGDDMKLFSFDSNEDVVPQVPVGPGLDKTGVDIKFDRLDLKLNHPEQYARFLKLYEHFRDCDFDSDTDFLPDAYTFKPYVKKPVDNVIIRNHMPYTYMPLILCDLPDEEAYAYMVEVPGQEEGAADWEMFVGEIYKLPFTKEGSFTWTSSDEAVVAIDEKGMMSGKSAGNAILTISTPGGNKTSFKICVSEG